MIKHFKTSYIITCLLLLVAGFNTTHAAIEVREGDVIRGPDGVKVYIVNAKGYKRHIFNPEVFNLYGHLTWDGIKDTDQAAIDSYITSDIYRAVGDAKVYQTADDGVKRWFDVTAEEFVSMGYSWDQVFVVNPAERDYYTTGTPITYSGTVKKTVPPVEGSELAVSLTSDNSASASVFREASNVVYLKFALTAGSSDVSVTNIKFRRSGTGKISNFSSIYLYDEDTAITSNYSAGSFPDEVEFNDLNLNITAGSSKTMSLTVDIDSNAGIIDTDSFSLIGVTSSVSVISELPISGNQMKIEVALTGNVTVLNLGPSEANIERDSNNVEFLRFAIASRTSAEVGKIRIEFHSASGQDLSTGDLTALSNKIKDVKITDIETGEIVWGPYDVILFSDIGGIQGVYYELSSGSIFSLAADRSRVFKITADLYPSLNIGDKFYVVLGKTNSYAFDSVSVKDTDTNQYITDIFPSSALTGNQMTIVE